MSDAQIASDSFRVLLETKDGGNLAPPCVLSTVVIPCE